MKKYLIMFMDYLKRKELYLNNPIHINFTRQIRFGFVKRFTEFNEILGEFWGCVKNEPQRESDEMDDSNMGRKNDI